MIKGASYEARAFFYTLPLPCYNLVTTRYNYLCTSSKLLNFASQIKKKMELLKEQFITFVGLLLSGWAGWLFGRPKQRVELQASELDNVDKAIHIYREMIDDLGEKYAKAIADLKEANLRIKELENSIENLLKQLRK